MNRYWCGTVNFPDSLFKPGDVFVLAVASLFTAGLFFNAWLKPTGDAVIVRAHGKVKVRATLNRDAFYEVQGKLGLSRIEVRHGMARVVSDPGPMQVCVKQGWVSRTGEASLCLANQVSLEIGGVSRSFDSLTY